MTHKATALPSYVPGVQMLDIRSNRDFPRHTHDQFGIGVMISGGHRSWSGRGEVQAVSGDVITVNPNEVHDGASLGDEIRHWRMFFIDPDRVRELCGRDIAAQEAQHPASTDPRLRSQVEEAIATVATGGADAATEVLTVLCDALLERSKPVDRQDTLSQEVARMVECLHDNVAMPPDLTELSAIAGLTRATAIRRFRREVGMTSHAYLIQLRVREARASIARGTSLAEAALQYGFSDQSHMTRAFTRQIGVSPGNWRRADAKTNFTRPPEAP